MVTSLDTPATPEHADPPGEGVDHLFVLNLMEQIRRQLNLSVDLLRGVQADALARIITPKRTELQAPLAVDKLRQENQNLLSAFRMALAAVPRHLQDDAMVRWREQTGQGDLNMVRGVIQRLEGHLSEMALSQIYTGCINLLDHALLKSQPFPVNWEGLRYRLLFAAADDVTPRGHLNYFCNFSARVVELLAGRGYDVGLLRHMVEAAIQLGGEYLRCHRQEHFSQMVQDAVLELTDSLQNILRVVEEISHNVTAALNMGEAQQESLNHALNGLSTRRAKLARTMVQIEASGVPVPEGLRGRLQEVVALSREIAADRATLAAKPERLGDITQRIRQLKRKAQAVSFEFRRVRRKSEVLLRQKTQSMGGQDQEPEPGGIADQEHRELVEAARNLLWCHQDAAFALDLRDLPQLPELLRVKAAMLQDRHAQPVLAQLESAIRRKPFDVFRFRVAGKRVLALVLEILRPVPPHGLSQQGDDPVWAVLADLSDAHARFSRLIEGDETRRLQLLPGMIQDLQHTLGAVRQDKVLTIPITPALEREKRCQEGLLRLSMAERLDNLQAPLSDLLRISLTVGSGDMGLMVARNRAMQALGVTRDADPERGRNALAELTVIPLVRLFQACDPKYGRVYSELERRLHRGPIPGLLPTPILYGVRKANSLDNLGRLEEAAEREHRAQTLVNRSGLLGVEMGLHPLWDEIIASDEVHTLATEMRPLFAGDAGRGFLVRVVADNPAFHDFQRLDENEMLAEANLLLEGLTHRDGFYDLQTALHQAACMLAGSELAPHLKENRRDFLLDQRGLLARLGVEDPLEYLRPVAEMQTAGFMEELEGVVSELSGREREIILLQLFHRRLLQPDILIHWLHRRYTSRDALVAEAPGLVSELLERFHWLLRNPGLHGEKETMAQLLEELELDEARQAVEEGVANLAQVRALVTRYRTIKAEDQDQTWTGRVISLLGARHARLRRLQGELEQELEHLRWLGLGREAAFLQREMYKEEP